MVTFMLVLFFVSFFIGTPLMVSMGLSALITIIFFTDIPLINIPLMMFESQNSFILTAIPLYLLTGNIMLKGDLSERLFNFAVTVVGRIRGSMGMVNVFASMLFGGISGAAVADAAGLGPIEIAAMTSKGYPRAYSAALSASSATLSVIIPPSILLIIYAVQAQISVAKSLAAGLLPGLLITFILMLVNYIISYRNNWSPPIKSNINDFFTNFKKAILVLLIPLLILWGIFGGTFTPTEAGAIAVFYSFIIACATSKELRSFKNIYKILYESGKACANAMVIITSSSLVSFVLSYNNIPMKIAQFVTSYVSNQYIFLAIIVIVLLLAGMFIASTSALIIFTPILFPTAISFGVDPLHFGIIMVSTLAIGVCTPPVGGVLFAITAVSGEPIEKIIVNLLPFYFALVFIVIILILVPAISTFIPSLLFN